MPSSPRTSKPARVTPSPPPATRCTPRPRKRPCACARAALGLVNGRGPPGRAPPAAGRRAVAARTRRGPRRHPRRAGPADLVGRWRHRGRAAAPPRFGRPAGGGLRAGRGARARSPSIRATAGNDRPPSSRPSWSWARLGCRCLWASPSARRPVRSTWTRRRPRSSGLVELAERSGNERLVAATARELGVIENGRAKRRAMELMTPMVLADGRFLMPPDDAPQWKECGLPGSRQGPARRGPRDLRAARRPAGVLATVIALGYSHYHPGVRRGVAGVIEQIRKLRLRLTSWTRRANARPTRSTCCTRSTPTPATTTTPTWRWSAARRPIARPEPWGTGGWSSWPRVGWP